MEQWSVRPNPAVPFEVRYEDGGLLVVEKPAGVVTQPGKGHQRDSLLNGLFARWPARLQNLGLKRDWGLLHRLDRDCSGLVIVALRNRVYAALREAFESQRVKKTYWAIVLGTPTPRQGVIQSPIAEVVGARKLAAIRRDGRKAVTAYRVLASGEGVSLIEARPATGRLHQIRVHLASIGSPILGDSIYGAAAQSIRVPRLCLHAARLSFVHPESSKRLAVSTDWPRDLETTRKRFRLPDPAQENGPRESNPQGPIVDGIDAAD